MNWEQLQGSVILTSMAAAVGLIVFVLMWLPMRRLLGANSRMVQARPFFIRAMFVTLILGAIMPVAGEVLSLPAGAVPMEYVWQAAGRLKDTVLSVSLYLFGFVVVMTVLSASLGRYRDE